MGLKLTLFALGAGEVYLQTKYGVALWVPGYTMRVWTCAVCGQAIPTGSPRVWRIGLPDTVEEGRLRICDPHVTEALASRIQVPQFPFRNPTTE